MAERRVPQIVRHGRGLNHLGINPTSGVGQFPPTGPAEQLLHEPAVDLRDLERVREAVVEDFSLAGTDNLRVPGESAE
jgi:hypothetical protein